MNEFIENNNNNNNNNDISYNLLEFNNINDVSYNFMRRIRPRRHENLYNPTWTSSFIHFNIPSNIILNTNLDPYNIITNETEELLERENDLYFLRNILEDSFSRDKNKYKKVLSDKGNNQLEEIYFKKKDNINTSCPIYQTDFQENEIITKLPCGHCFTTEAIIKWLKEQQAICPVCRYELDSKEVKNDDLENDDLENDNLENNNLENNELENNELVSNFSNNIIQNSISNILEILENRYEQEQLQEAIMQSIRN